MQKLHVHQKSRIACFGKNKKLTPTLLRCAHTQTNQLFALFKPLDAQKCVLGPGDLLACPEIHRFIYQFVNFL